MLVMISVGSGQLRSVVRVIVKRTKPGFLCHCPVLCFTAGAVLTIMVNKNAKWDHQR